MNARSISGERGWLLLVPLSLGGLAASAYLTYSHYADRPTECAGVGSCEFVQTSEYADILGVPVALLGLLFFLAFGALVLTRLAAGPGRLPWAQPAAFSMALGGLAFVTYLTYVELFVIDAICPWCVATAVFAAACFAITAWGAIGATSERHAEGI